MYRELELLSNLDFRFHAYHPFRFASHCDLRSIHHDAIRWYRVEETSILPQG
jgi:hypothetical protein